MDIRLQVAKGNLEHRRVGEVRNVTPIRSSEDFYRLWHEFQRHRFVTLLASLILLFVAVAFVFLFQDPSQRLLAGLRVRGPILFRLRRVRGMCAARH